MKNNRLSRFAVPYVIWMALFVVAPIIMVVIYAFSTADGGATLANFCRKWAPTPWCSPALSGWR